MAPKKYVAFDVRATGSEDHPVPQCEITEMGWVVIDAETGRVEAEGEVLVSPEYTSTPTPGIPLAAAVERIEAALEGVCGGMITDGSFPLRRALKLEAAVKNIKLSPIWLSYTDLRKECMRLFPEIAMHMTSVEAILKSLGLPPLPNCPTPRVRCRGIASVVEYLAQRSMPFHGKPQQISNSNRAAMERQWRSVPVPRQLQPSAAGDTEMCCVRLRGLPFQASRADIDDFFKGFHIAEDGVKFLHNAQGKPKGEAFVRFVDEGTAREAQKRDKQFMGERYIEVFPASLQEMEAPQPTAKGASTKTPSTVRCTGLPSSNTLLAAKRFLADCAVSSDEVTVCEGADGWPTGEIYVKLATEEECARMLKRHRQVFDGHYIEVARCKEQVAAPQGKVQEKRGGSPSLGYSNFSPYVIRLRGMPLEARERDVLRFCHGLRICSRGIHMIFSYEQQPTGEAFVELEDYESVVHGVQRSNTFLGTRRVEVVVSSADDIMRACGAPSEGAAVKAVQMAPATPAAPHPVPGWGAAPPVYMSTIPPHCSCSVIPPFPVPTPPTSNLPQRRVVQHQPYPDLEPPAAPSPPMPTFSDYLEGLPQHAEYAAAGY